jgi:hypothetical protein
MLRQNCLKLLYQKLFHLPHKIGVAILWNFLQISNKKLKKEHKFRKKFLRFQKMDLLIKDFLPKCIYIKM